MVLPNIVAVGIYDSQIAARNTQISKNRNTTMFEIELPIENGGISYIDSSCFYIEPNMLVCAKPNQKRHTKFPYKCIFIHMIIEDAGLADILFNTQNFIPTANYDEYNRIFNKIVKHYNFLSENEELILQSLVLELIYKISKEKAITTYSRKDKGNDHIIGKSIKYIKNHLTENLNLEIVSKEMSLSPVYFHKKFKASTGKTIRDYIEEQRIKKSIYLLQTTDYSLTRIAYECGFSSQSYFSYVFKRRMKQTPREYLKDIYDKYKL